MISNIYTLAFYIETQNIEKEEEPIDLDSLTPEQMKEILKNMMGKQ